MTLTAKKFTEEKFATPGGYFMPTGWGVKNSDGQWVAFAGNLYNPQGGRSAALEVVEGCDPTELSYISEL